MDELYLTCARGLENILHDEIKTLVKQKINIDKGGIYFNGSLEDMYRINYQTRIGMNLHYKLFEVNLIYQLLIIYNSRIFFVASLLIISLSRSSVVYKR